MKTVKTKKVIISILLFAMIATILTTTFAVTIDGVTVNPKESNGSNTAKTIGNQILGIFKIVGVIASVGCLMILGIKYMMGSAEEKAEYKKSFIPYIIGAVLLFAASAFAGQIQTWAEKIFSK